MIRISPGPSLRTLEPHLLLAGCSLNTIFRGPTNAHNPLFAAVSAVIKDWGRGSRKWAQTPSVNPVCACGRRAKKKKKELHIGGRWHAHVCFVSFCVFFCTGRGGEQLAAASQDSADAPDPSDTPAATSQGKGKKQEENKTKNSWSCRHS